MFERSLHRPTSSRLAAAAVAAALPLIGVAAAAGPAVAMCGDEMITAHASDTTPASGQQFVVRGKFFIGDGPAADHVVKVQTKRDGAWVPITGAHVTTDSAGKYRVRLVLSQTGARTMRVVGVGQGHEMTVWAKFKVSVS